MIRPPKGIKVLVVLTLGIGLAAFLWIDPVGLFTVYAPDFTFARWNALPAGLSQSEVCVRLGEPFERVEMKWNSEFPEVWYYSRKRSLNVLFRDYRVYFDAHKNVTRKTRHLEF